MERIFNKYILDQKIEFAAIRNIKIKETVFHIGSAVQDNNDKFILSFWTLSDADDRYSNLITDLGNIYRWYEVVPVYFKIAKDIDELMRSKLRNGNFILVDYDDPYREGFEIGYDPPDYTAELAYPDGIKLIYHHLKGFDTYCRKYVPESCWQIPIHYGIEFDDDRVKEPVEIITARNYENYKRIGHMEKLLKKGKREKIYFDRIKITKTYTNQDWLDLFHAELPLIEEEYQKLVREGKIDESDVVIWEE